RKAFHLFCSNYIYLDTESIVQLSSKIIADRLDSDNEIAESWVELLSRQNLSVDMRKKLAEMVNSSDKNANNPDFSLGFLDSLFRGPLDELDSAGVGAFAQILINMSGDLRPTFNQYWNKLRRARHFNSDSIDAVTSLVKYGPSKRANQSNIETAALDLTREHIHQLSPTSWATLIYFFYFSNQESIRTKEMTEAWSQLINFPNVSSLAIKEVLDLLDWHYHEIEPNRLKAFLVSLSSMTNFDSAEVVAFYAMIDDYQWKKKRLFAELFGTFLDQGKISKDSLVAYLLRIVQKHSDVDGFTKFISYRRFLKIFLSHKGPWPHSLREAWRIYIGKKILPTDSYDRHFLDSEMSLFFQGFIAHSYNHWNEDIHAA
ncbi:MAG: hypothetical protein KDD35_12155, partial [Bdellovibrionales bacterium]|nr:hypothetical protein [Bdellovibrionales bacterium]